MIGKKSVGDWPWARRQTGQADENRVCRADCRVVSAKLLLKSRLKLFPIHINSKLSPNFLKTREFYETNSLGAFHCCFIDSSTLSSFTVTNIKQNEFLHFASLKTAELFLFVLSAGMKLEVCFMNESATDLEADQEVAAASAMAGSNTSAAKPPVPMVKLPKSTSSDPEVMQREAQMALAQASRMAHMEMALERQNMRLSFTPSPTSQLLKKSMKKVILLDKLFLCCSF
jgi:hypothetical protein